MAYDLEAFCHDCRNALNADKGPGGREAVRRHLEKLLGEKAFLDRHVLSMPAGRHTLYEDPVLGFVVLSHVNTKAATSPPVSSCGISSRPPPAPLSTSMTFCSLSGRCRHNS